jgi:glycosyltransferase involved in cell wall biosynthesis
MKVLVIHNAGQSNLPSGEMTVVNAEAGELVKKGITVECHIEYNDQIINSSAAKTIAAGLNIFWSYDSYRTTQRLIERHQPDVVHYHSVLPLLTASTFYACRSKGVPVVQTLHNYRWFCVEGGLYRDNAYCQDCLDRGSHRGVMERCSRNSLGISSLLTLNNEIYVRRKKLFELVDTFIAVSHFLRDKHIEAGFPAEQLVVKYNGIDAASLSEEIVPGDKRRGITFVGRLTPAKGTDMLVEIMRRIRDVPINIVGSGPELAKLSSLCEASRFGHVNFLGRKTSAEVLDLMATSACVVVPSVFAETFGLVAAEAMACGTPVVASNVGALEEIVGSSGGGLTVSPELGVEGFVNAINSIITSPDKIHELGTRGRNFVAHNLTLESSVEKLISIYQQVIAKRHYAVC